MTPQVIRAGSLLALVCLFLPPAAAKGRVPSDKEPSSSEVRRLQQAALRAAHLDPQRYQSILTRHRVAGLLPRLHLSLGRGFQVSQSLRPYLGTTPASVSDGDHTSYSLSASWDLARLLSPSEEAKLLSEAQHASERGNRLCVEIAKLYYERQEALAQGTPKGHRKAEEIRAILEALTGYRETVQPSPALPEVVDDQEP